ncbi:MAG: M15 family metallopeptidase [Deltaproteobacteria bacterium]|jgi:LAS superfamily LD-carboxypeptidase LdcB|nr:M15 family metallopeptidase [Deltaproteobacteria bacterium]MBT4265187.1 M15 family metallopeptidase [Deltaproteobacteria bacterium]MBT4638622.1 M15 family metallopeptidase [Deltaproteobacteria bacterium]MBT6503515.1 M15 family metallopeptidase [Deltaproteobacteria bacterium]MBT6611609.1 M15 family metallopeptidase [Deltaproteobacteria bacterium]
MNQQELTGKARSHIRQFERPRFAVQAEVADAFFEMKRAAVTDGIELHPFSAFRDFDVQLRIWNLKYSGQRPLYSIDGKQLNFDALLPEEVVRHILNWTALPGGSRHHWGTDIDVIDSAALPENYQIKLLPEETEKGGVFYKLHCWLDENMERFGFFRPYAHYQNGIHPERWHISYEPVSRPAMSAFTQEFLEEAIANSQISGMEIVLSMLPDIYQNYIMNITQPGTDL